METTSLSDMIKYANLFRQSWNNGLDTNMIDPSEAKDSNEEWVRNYHTVISQDIISEAKKNDEIFAMISELSENEYNDLFDMVSKYVLDNVNEIAKAIEN